MGDSEGALPCCLEQVLFGATEEVAPKHARRAPFIACVGCRLGEKLAPVEAFLHTHATNAPPWHLYKLVADFYAHRVRPTLGEAAPEWTADAIRAHYETCAFSLRLTVIGKLLELRGLREMLFESLRAAEGGEAPSQTLSLYAKVCAHESAQHALLMELPPPPSAQPLAPPPLPSSARAPPRHSPPPSSMDDAASVASTARADSSDAIAQEALRGALSELLEPCVPVALSAQPTLDEFVHGASTADVVVRDRKQQVQAFQDGRAPSGRRCFCRAGKAPCHVRLSREFLQRLVEDAPVLERAFRSPAALRRAIQTALHLRAGDMPRRWGFKPNTLFGFRERVQSPTLRNAASCSD